jgi:hypothetical protein
LNFIALYEGIAYKAEFFLNGFVTNRKFQYDFMNACLYPTAIGTVLAGAEKKEAFNTGVT